jgi:hypothetical protein
MTVQQAERFVDEIRAEFPKFRIVYKDGDALSKLIDFTLKLITLGRQREYLTHYHTVLGNTLYVPRRWERTSDVDRVILLRHERVHLRQRRRLGFVLLALAYLIPFFPLGLAYGRARLEWEAYCETLRATAELRGLDAVRSPELRQMIVERFTGPAYGWMWPFPRQVESWYDQILRELENAWPCNR